MIFAGSAPKYIDAVPEKDAEVLYERAVQVPFEKHRILSSLEDERTVSITDISGVSCNQFLSAEKR